MKTEENKTKGIRTTRPLGDAESPSFSSGSATSGTLPDAITVSHEPGLAIPPPDERTCGEAQTTTDSASIDSWRVEIVGVHVDDSADRVRRILDLILRSAARAKIEPPAEPSSKPSTSQGA